MNATARPVLWLGTVTAGAGPLAEVPEFANLFGLLSQLEAIPAPAAA